MIHLYKEVNGETHSVELGLLKHKESYEKQGYVVGCCIKTTGISKKVENKFIIYHIHRQQFDLRGRINNLICKLIPERFLSY